ncbi:MAG: deoxyribodipyrimidine photolyase [Acidimicrobiia bacterium]|nr:deoxyribodipyrimidine photolyase [Acidimicrobiia bacterium]
MTRLQTPTLADAVDWTAEYLGHLAFDEVAKSGRFTGGQRAADEALAGFDVTGYASKRNEVWPESRRGASALSPYIRHGLLQLPRVWDAVAGGPSRDVKKYRDELNWQEYARHLYARLGTNTRNWIRYSVEPTETWDHEPWWRQMACVDLVVSELENDGWLVNQTRMWMASQWVNRAGADWRDGEDRFFRHLLDGSRAANRLGWLWTTGGGIGKPYGFSRWQVEKRAEGVCDGCQLNSDCPIDYWPSDPEIERVPEASGLRSDPDPAATGGPLDVDRRSEPEVVWLTAESLGDDDPALSANLDLPAVFVFDEPLLGRLQLSGKRLVFLAETLADLAARRDVEVQLGSPGSVLADRAPAVTFAPVPGFRRIGWRLEIAELHPFPWLRRPRGGSVASFSQWLRS